MRSIRISYKYHPCLNHYFLSQNEWNKKKTSENDAFLDEPLN